ncbi:hypothetical protein HME9302_02581 [Alteripontixanthobacter maritimus]|uniref:HTH cro/C1-type domain-containing protein n=1 Tax=Alteripontixanthobacter maritimus TaxID=2161824 RepID=A0A369QEM4_9SPHN|nr:hypothetical protein HME9302_02581 [Alteripontixanthobacter maritimus]
MKPRKTLLPSGYGPLKDDIGQIIREKRRDNDGVKLTQKELAELAEVPQETISRIESGRRLPTYATLYKIMGALNLEWSDLAEKAGSGWPTLSSISDTQQDLAQALRAGRKELDLTLRELSREIGISIGTLSRLERGQSPRSKWLTRAKHRDTESDPEEVRYVFTCQNLNLLANIGWEAASTVGHPVFDYH